MGLTVIIPTYKRPQDLQRLFESLQNQTLQPNEILVVIGPGDSESIEITEEWRRKIPWLRIIKAHKPSVIHALNLGMPDAANEIIALLDDDVWLPADWTRKIITAFAQDVHMGVFGGRDRLQNTSPELVNPQMVNLVGKFTLSGHKGYHHCGSKFSPVKVDVIKGVNLSFRRSAFPSLRINPVLEDKGAETCWEMDLCLKVKQAGFEIVYDNDNYVLHYWSPRLGFDNRTDVFSTAWAKRIFNESFIYAKYRPMIEISIWALRLFLIGTRVQPGIIWSLLLVKKYGLAILRIPWRNTIFIWKGTTNGFRQRCKTETS